MLDHEPRLMIAHIMWMSVRNIWAWSVMPAQHQWLIIKKTERILTAFNWSSRSWTWSDMPAHGPRHSNISMIHIEILNGFRDTRYWVKAPYQLKYQDQGEFSKIQDVNASTLPTQHQDLVNQKDRIWPLSCL
jgi:hypothetical protein